MRYEDAGKLQHRELFRFSAPLCRFVEMFLRPLGNNVNVRFRSG